MKASCLFQTTRLAVRECLFCILLFIVATRMPMAVMGQSIYATPYTFTTLAGEARYGGTNDGTGSAPRFGDLEGEAIDNAGNIFVTDTGNETIRKVTPAGMVTTLAGLPGYGGTNDGTGSAARFDNPWGVATDTNGNLYVADTTSSTIRKVAPVGTNWMVTTLAGQPLNGGTNDGTNGGAQFYGPAGVAVDGTTNIYVADYVNHTIRKVTPVGTNWMVTTLAGLAGTHGTNDGTNSGARFFGPTGVAVDGAKNLYVVDTQNCTIRKGYPPGSVPQPVIQPPGLSAGQFGFGITGLPNLAVDVQSSSDLTNWQIADANYYVLVNGTNFYPGPSAPQGNEFYRVHVR
jgi:hypothetical protein